jgi:hypothetical protein
VFEEIPNLKDLVTSFYDCEYASFMRAMAAIHDQV